MKRSKSPIANTTKVLFMLPTLQPGGAERILITLMNNIDRDRFSPELVALNEDGPIKDWIADDVPFHRFGHRTIKGSVLKMIALVKKVKPDVIFTTMVHSNGLALLMKVLFPHIRVIVREAALPSVLLSEYGLRGRLCVLIYKLLYSKADLVISNCSQMIDQFRDEIKISTDNHSLLFNPVDTDRVYAAIPAKLETFQDRKKTQYFVSVGRLSYEKGYDRLIHKLAHEFKDNPNWRYDLIGEGAYRTRLEKLIRKLGLERHVILRGYYSQPWKIAAQADCLLLPSRWEGMPNVVLEGFSCGIPAIAMREAGGIVDIAKYTQPDQLQIFDTIDDCVTAMKVVPIKPKKSRDASILPDEFLLSHIMKQFESILKPHQKESMIS
jgi:glycosyltransferase involved in cell wall biosynthesis